jgi:hypothetical protein
MVRELHAWCALTSAAAAAMLLLAGDATEPRRQAAMRALLVMLALQCASGAVLQVVYSPFTAGVRANVDIVLHDPRLGHWNVLHPVLALVTLAVAWQARRHSTLRWRLSSVGVVALTASLALWFS